MCKCVKIHLHTQILSFQSFMSSLCATSSSRINLNSFHSLYLFSLVLSPVNSQIPIMPNTNEVSIDYQILKKKKNPPGKLQLKGSWGSHCWSQMQTNLENTRQVVAVHSGVGAHGQQGLLSLLQWPNWGQFPSWSGKVALRHQSFPFLGAASCTIQQDRTIRS